MLLIPTYVEKSEIDGLGLFTTRDIQKGEVVWLLDPNADVVFDEEEYNKMIQVLSIENKERFNSWSYRRGPHYILCADNSNFWNHSETNPNCGGEHMSYTVALRDIKSGEELLENYKEYDTNCEVVEDLYKKENCDLPLL